MRTEAPPSSTDAHAAQALIDNPAAGEENRPPISDLVPDLAGLTVGCLDQADPVTWAATQDTFAFLDACQYVAGGPCVTAVAEGRPVVARPAEPDVWPLFSRACSAAGIESVLSLPLRDDAGEVVGSVNLYATDLTAFEGRHDELTAWSSEWKPATAVSHGTTVLGPRWDRAAAPERQRDENSIDRAVATLATTLGIDVVDAADRLRSAASRAGMGESAVAQSLDQFLGSP